MNRSSKTPSTGHLHSTLAANNCVGDFIFAVGVHHDYAWWRLLQTILVSLELINNSPLTVLMVLCLYTTGTCAVLSATSVTSLDPACHEGPVPAHYMNMIRRLGARIEKMLHDLPAGRQVGEVAEVEPIERPHGLYTKKLLGDFTHGPRLPRRGGDCPYTAMTRALTNSL